MTRPAPQNWREDAYHWRREVTRLKKRVRTLRTETLHIAAEICEEMAADTPPQECADAIRREAQRWRSNL